MGFHEVSFPEHLSYGSEGGPAFQTTIVESDSGIDFRASRWDSPRHKYDLSYAIKTYELLTELKIFFIARHGALYGFRFKDPLDFTTNEDGTTTPATADQVLGTGDGTEVSFQMRKKYTSGGIDRWRTINKPVSGTTIIAIDGTPQGSGWSINTTTGIVTFSSAPSAGEEVTGACEFEVPVRFSEGTDELLRITHDDFGSGSCSNLEIVEILDPEPTTAEIYYGGAKTQSISEDISITHLDGVVHKITPSGAGLKVYLPDPDELPTGGPYFFIKNGSGSQTLQIVGANGTSVVTIPTEGMVEILLGLSVSSAKEWYAMS